MRYRVTHTTRYRYSEPASLSQNELSLQPRQTATLHVDEWQLAISPLPQHQRQREDFFGNVVHTFMIHHPHHELEITATSSVTTHSLSLPLAESTLAWEEVVNRLNCHTTPETLSSCLYRYGSPLTLVSQEMADYGATCFPPGIPVLAGAITLMEKIFSEFAYDKNATTVDTPVAHLLATLKGVCQDFANLMLSCLRSLGLSARYVSGYLETRPPEGKPRLVGADASHAWVSLFVPDLGWIDLDPTNNCLPGEQHIALAWGRDYGDVTPVKGVVMGGGSHSLTVMVDVLRLEP